MITSLTLKNWRTHAETKLDFGKGTNVIVGVMGSGKSSIVNAISYSLFGTFPALKSKSVTLEEIIMNRPNPASKVETILEFNQGEKKYQVHRIIKKDSTNEAKLYEEGRLIAGPKQKDVNEKVERTLGLNYELFSRAVYAEQNEMDFFLKLSPSERKKKFDELLDLAKYEEARKNAVMIQNEMNKENKQRKDFIEQQKNMLKIQESEKIEKEIFEIKKTIEHLEKKLCVEEKELIEFEKKYKEESEKEKQSKIFEETIIKTSTKIESLKEDLNKGVKYTEKEIKEKAGVLKKTIEEKNTIQEKLGKEKKENEENAKKLGQILSVLEYEKKKMLAEEKNYSSLKGECPTCKQELTEEHKKHLLKELNEKLNQIEKEINENKKNQKNEREKMAGVEAELEALKKETEKYCKELYLFEAEEKQAKLLEEKKKIFQNLIEELPKTKKQLAELNFNKKEMQKIQEEYHAKKTQISLTQMEIKSKKELAQNLGENLKKAKLIKESIEEGVKKYEKSENAAKNLGVFSNCLISTQTELRESLIETTNAAMNNIWQAIYPYKDYIDAKLSVTKEGYDLEVMTRGNEWVRVEGILSGGERSAAALCIRMAFSLVLTKKLSMLILDEPTHNLDTNAVEKLSAMLREEMPKLVEQIFVITHDKELENAASSNLYLLTRNKDNDETTKTETIPVNST